MKEKVNVTGVPETMVQTLYARAKETKKQNAKIKDEIAVELVEKLDYDFSIADKDNAMNYGVIARTIVLDRMVEQYLKKHENTVVVKPPMLKIEKTSDHKIYKEGQTGSYKIRVTQKNEGMTAHKVIIEDLFEKKGMDIGMIRVKYNGEDITNQCEISRDDTSRKFKIATGRDLSDKDELLVIYDTAFLSMIDGDIKNTAFAYSEDADKVRDDIVVTMEENIPQLLITKRSDKTVYKAGGICEYQIFVSQIVKDAVAKNIVIEDKIDHKYAKIIKESVHVFSPDEADITSKCRIVVSDNSFRIETKENLTNDQKIKVIYQVKLNNKIMKDRTIKNTAKAKADKKTIILPESMDTRTWEAAEKILKEGLANLIILGSPEEVEKYGKGYDVTENITYTKNKGNDFENTATSSGPKTGDESDLRWIFAMAAAAFSGILLLYRKKKH